MTAAVTSEKHATGPSAATARDDAVRDNAERRQRRLLMVSTAVNTLGNGAYLPLALIVLTAVTGLRLVTVGAVLTLAELCALPLMPLTGVLVDRFGAGRAQTMCHAARCVGFAAYLGTHTIATFAGAAVLVAAAERSSRVSGPALIAETLSGAARERYLVLERALSNAGLGLGGVIAAILLAAGGHSGYVAVMVVTSACFGVAATLTCRLRCLTCADRVASSSAGGWRAVISNRPFRTLTLANTCSAFGYVALAMLIPIYAIAQLGLPAALAGALFTLNTVLCATASVPLSGWLSRRGITGVRRAGTGLALMAAGFGLMAAAAIPTAVGPAAALIVAAVVVYTIGEITHAPAAASLALNMAEGPDRGRYLGVYQLSWATAAALAPALFTALVGRCPLALLAGLVTLDFAAILALRSATTPRRRPNRRSEHGRVRATALAVDAC